MKRFSLTIVGALGVGAALAGAGGAAQSAQPPSSIERPSISGSTNKGSTLTASTGTWSGDTPMSFKFQWRRCNGDGDSCSDIGGETGLTYTVKSADVGHRLRVRVTATNAVGSASAESLATSVVGGEGQAPVNTTRPSVAGDFREGGTLAANVGKWSGSDPISYTLQWQRCTADGQRCDDISGATRSSYVLGSTDVGRRLRVIVRASNKYGSGFASSDLDKTALVAAGGNAPANTAAPTLSGAPQVGQTLTLAAGTWKGATPMTFAYAWQRCNGSGSACAMVANATSRTYKLSSSDVGSTLRGVVTASNKYGRTSVLTAPTSPITVALPSGAIKLPSGLVSLPVTSVAPPERLVIDEVSFTPPILRSRNPFTGSFRVRDTRGYAIRDAAVLVVGVPFGRIKPPSEVVTGTDGTAIVQMVPTRRLPLVRGGALVLFVRARKPGENVLAGVSARRLVSIRTARP